MLALLPLLLSNCAGGIWTGSFIAAVARDDSHIVIGHSDGSVRFRADEAGQALHDRLQDVLQAREEMAHAPAPAALARGTRSPEEWAQRKYICCMAARHV